MGYTAGVKNQRSGEAAMKCSVSSGRTLWNMGNKGEQLQFMKARQRGQGIQQRILVWVLVSVGASSIMLENWAVAATPTIEYLHAQRVNFLDQFRTHGVRDSGQAKGLKIDLEKFIKQANGHSKARALFELATMHRITEDFDAAIHVYQQLTDLSDQLSDSGLAFDAWLGIARSYAYGTRNHGAAAAAFDRAVANAGEHPTPKQRYEIADYASQFHAMRGELEEALLSGLEAIQAAHGNTEYLFYAALDMGDVLQKFAERCDYQKLIDAKTYQEDDLWGACERAVEGAGTYYIQAQQMAQRQGWTFLVNQTQEFLHGLALRLRLIRQKSAYEQIGQAKIFNAQNVREVLVNDNFSSGGSDLSADFSLQALAALMDQIPAEGQGNNPRNVYLKGIQADLQKNPDQALAHYLRAAHLLMEERTSFFDIRQRGTVTEDRPEIFRDLGLRLLALQRWGEAFSVFESTRAQGMGNLAGVLSNRSVTQKERRWLAQIIQVESQASSIQHRLVEAAIAGIDQGNTPARLLRLHTLKQERQQILLNPPTQEFRHTLTSASPVIPTLEKLEAHVRRVDIPVLLYWITPTNVVVWVIHPQGLQVKTVFLPEVVLAQKVSRLVASVRMPRQAFDEQTARILHTYLLKPFEPFLTGKQVIVVPHGPLVGLPFEALMDAETGQFVAEQRAIAYAPNAAFAIAALQPPWAVDGKITALYDQEIEDLTHEVAAIQKMPALTVHAVPVQQLRVDDVVPSLGGTAFSHLLLHGEFDHDDPLQSYLSLKTQEGSKQRLTAADLLAVDWTKTKLAVLSACEGAQVKMRISHEIFGFPWPLLTGGAEHVIVSRWRVSDIGNAQWVEHFYQRLIWEGMTPALAANAARRHLLASSYRHPYYWAGPQVFGR